MDIILITSRGAAGPTEWSRELAGRTARELIASGHRVRWLRSGSSGEVPAGFDGVELHPVAARTSAFRKVRAAVEDPPMERLLAQEIRRRLPDVVHVIGFGRGVSAAILWVARRMGVPPVVTLAAPELLCHRTTLVDETGKECRAWADIRRCAECCLTAYPGGLGPAQARLGRLLEPLGGWSPYPNRHAFRSRLDLLMGSLEHAETIFVGNEEDRDLLLEARIPVPVRTVDLECEHGAALVGPYRDLAAVSAGVMSEGA